MLDFGTSTMLSATHLIKIVSLLCSLLGVANAKAKQGKSLYFKRTEMLRKTLNAPAACKSEAWKHFGFPLSNKKGQKVTDRKHYAHTAGVMPY